MPGGLATDVAVVEPEYGGVLVSDAELSGGWRRICHGGNVEGQMVERPWIDMFLH